METQNCGGTGREWECWRVPETREPLGCGPPHRYTCITRPGKASPALDFCSPCHLPSCPSLAPPPGSSPSHDSLKSQPPTLPSPIPAPASTPLQRSSQAPKALTAQTWALTLEAGGFHQTRLFWGLLQQAGCGLGVATKMP